MIEDSTVQNDRRRVAPRSVVSARKHAVAFAGFVLLLLTHVGLRAAPDSKDIAPWLPNELALRCVWMLIAWAYLLWLSASLWRDPAEPRPERSTTARDATLRSDGPPRGAEPPGGDA